VTIDLKASIDLAGIRIPDSQLAREATVPVRDTETAAAVSPFEPRLSLGRPRGKASRRRDQAQAGDDLRQRESRCSRGQGSVLPARQFLQRDPRLCLARVNFAASFNQSKIPALRLSEASVIQHRPAPMREVLAYSGDHHVQNSGAHHVRNEAIYQCHRRAGS
jgi:hypothetical protein